uniref:RNase H type-1 domain-containing protein n=1 Tax=Brassica oleracea TaxID=3712 RepID=A0A3P6GKF1_BRAOL|nr:unnamed protein product [Brassica oleracea]
MHCFFNCQYAKNVWDLIPLSKAVHLAAGMIFPEVVVKFRRVICLPPSGISLNILPWINLDNDQVTCKTDAAWHKEKLVAELGWVFSGPRLESPIKGSMCEASIGSPLVAEASAVRSAMCMAINLEFSSLEVLSDNLTLIRAISGITQAKEIIGIVKDIRSISTEFASISFAHISRSLNVEADNLAKESLRFSYLLY